MVLELVLFGHPVVQMYLGRPTDDGPAFVSNTALDTDLAEEGDDEEMAFGFAGGSR